MTTTVNFLVLYNNVDWHRVVTLTDGAGDPVDISTATFFMEVRPSLGGDPVLDLALGSGFSLFTNGADGKLLLHVDHLLMEAVTPGGYKYDLVMVRSGVSEIVMRGTIKVKAGVTDL